jgi:WD40 repeat protein
MLKIIKHLTIFTLLACFASTPADAARRGWEGWMSDQSNEYAIVRNTKLNSSCGSEVKVINTINDKTYFSDSTDAICNIAISGNGKYFGYVHHKYSANEQYKVYERMTGKLILTIPTQAKLSMFSADGDYLAITNYKSWLKIYDVKTGKNVYTHKTKTKVEDLVFSNDGERLYFVDSDNILMWQKQSNTVTSGNNGYKKLKLSIANRFSINQPEGLNFLATKNKIIKLSHTLNVENVFSLKDTYRVIGYSLIKGVDNLAVAMVTMTQDDWRYNRYKVALYDLSSGRMVKNWRTPHKCNQVDTQYSFNDGYFYCNNASIFIEELTDSYTNKQEQIFEQLQIDEINKIKGFVSEIDNPLSAYYPERQAIIPKADNLYLESSIMTLQHAKDRGIESFGTLISYLDNSTLHKDSEKEAVSLVVSFVEKTKRFEHLKAVLGLPQIPNATKNQLIEVVFNYVNSQTNIRNHLLFIQEFPEQKEFIAKSVDEIFDIISKENNIAGYKWFIEKFGSSRHAAAALRAMHAVAYEIADDIDSLEAYNDFIIAYPTAIQVREANDRAYELERSEYVGMLSYFSEEKDARRLLVQSKMLEQSAEDLSSDEKVGYMMVVNRMNDLLKQEFNSTDAALRHLESNEFKSFVRTFKRSMKDLKRQVSRIADNTEDLSSIMKNQSSMMNNHFESAAQDREMASELTKQHRHWERFIGEVGL